MLRCHSLDVIRPRLLCETQDRKNTQSPTRHPSDCSEEAPILTAIMAAWPRGNPALSATRAARAVIVRVCRATSARCAAGPSGRIRFPALSIALTCGKPALARRILDVDPREFPNQDIEVEEDFLRRNEPLLIYIAGGLAKAALETEGAIDTRCA